MLSFAWFVPIFWGMGVGILAMVLHEFGHILAAYIVGVRVKALRAGWKGMYIVRETGTPRQNLIIALAGPLTNIVLLAARPLSKHIFLANLCCGLVNLLPIRGADGDSALGYWKEMQDSKK
ncbi:MAG: M50 family metallopeptidase [Terracidiphilus sp.]|nr:M50 family metallopeptidase [Terracidiphilus sp.]